MTNSEPAIVPGEPAAELCPSCEHPVANHDALGLRWCAATRLGVGSRGCLCAEAAHQKNWALAHY